MSQPLTGYLAMTPILGIMLNPLSMGLLLLGLVVSISIAVKGNRVAGIVLTVLFVVLLVLDAAIPGMVPGRPIAQHNTCLAQIKVINLAIEQLSKENGMAAGSEIDLASVTSRLKGGKLPVCPAGGFYKLSTVGKPVSCSLPEHANNMPSKP